MFITVHAAIATLAGSQISNPILAFFAGMGLHFVFDIIPHGDKELGKKFWGLKMKKVRREDKLTMMALYGSMDACALVIYLVFIFKTFDFAKSDSVSMAILGGVLPDLIVGLYQFTKFKWLKWFYTFHNKVHYLLLSKLENDIPIKYGMLLQGIGLALLISLHYFV
ncbi:MAG: hypothetical protein WCV92_00600 [Candidatus Buchananbacteria bacterium]